MPEFDTIKSSLAKYDDSQLLEIWIEHDTITWTPDAMRAVSQILAERGHALPSPGGAGADVIRQKRISIREERSKAAVRRFSRAACYFFAFFLALPVAAVATLLLAAVGQLLPIAEKWSVELAAFGAIAVYLSATGYLAAMLIRKFGSEETHQA